MATSSEITYHIIGGGIAGLSCAWLLKEKRPDIRSVIYEAGDRLGGRAYSYSDKALSRVLDNSVHAVVGANSFMSRFIQKDEWHKAPLFFDLNSGKLDKSLYANQDLLLKSFCNTSAQNVAPKIKQNILRSFFPFTPSKRKVWFSEQNISQRIINILAGYADEIRLKHKLHKIVSQFGMAAQLDFLSEQIDIGARDKVILALDNLSCSKILQTISLEHSSIVNIIYQTSQTLFLPQGASFIGVRGGSFDWLFSNSNLLTAVVSDYTSEGENLSHLVMKIWKEIDKIRGINSAFVPAFKAICTKNATIKQDIINNSHRPDHAFSQYPNVFIAGDWTMKDYPCCMETAFNSAKRAIKTALAAA